MNFCDVCSELKVEGLKWNKLWQVWKLRRAEISFSRLSIVVVSPVCSYQIYSKMYESFANGGKIANIPESGSLDSDR